MKRHSTVPIHHFNTAHGHHVSFRVEKLETAGEGYTNSEPHRHTYYEIFLFRESGGTHTIDFNVHPIEADHVHFVSPGQVHLVERNRNVSGYVLTFSREFFYFNIENKNTLLSFPFFDNSVACPLLGLNSAEAAEVQSIIESILKEENSAIPYKEDILRAYLNILLLKCKAAYEASHHSQKLYENTGAQLVQNFRLLVEDQFIRCHKVNEYAEQLSVTPNHLNEVTKRITGRTASELIQERILLEARRLLLHSNLTGKEVAYNLGFNDPSYFSRFFRTNTGLSPEAFKTENREKYLKT